MSENKKFARTLATILLSAIMVFGCAFAAFAEPYVGNTTGWERTASGGWRYIKATGTMAANEWVWIGEESTGFHCYFFDGNGNLVTNAITTDGYRVDSNGAWVENGVEVTRMLFDTTRPPYGNEITNGSAIAPVALSGYFTGIVDVRNTADGFQSRTYIQTMSNGDVLFNTTNNGTQIKIQTSSDPSDMVVGIEAPARLMFPNFPAAGIEENALFDNMRNSIISTGSGDISTEDLAVYFDTDPYSFTSAAMIIASDRDYEVVICLTQGTDGRFYVYPESPVFMKVYIPFSGEQILGPAYQ